MKNKKMIVGIILIIGILLLVGTFAWFTWRSSETTLVLKVGEIDDAEVILTPYKINKELIPALTYEGEEYTSVEAINRNTNAKRIILYYHINNIDSELINDSFKYTILKSSDNGNTYQEYSSGNFSNTSSDSEFYIMNERVETKTSYKYKVYLWLDGSSSGQGNIQGKIFDGELRAEILDGKIYANLGGEKEFYKADTYREKITKVEFVDNMDIPNGSVTFDLGAYPSKTDEVKGWLISNGTDTYTLKIGSNDKIYVNSLFQAFRKMTNLKEISFNNLDTSETTSMQSMFSYCSNLTSLDLSGFDTSKVNTMYGMFYECNNLATLNVGSFNTSNVNDMHEMFYNCNKLTSLNLSNFDTSNVTNMNHMFSLCNSLNNLNISSFNTSNVKSMRMMFNGCSSLTSLDVGSFNTSNVITMAYMFRNCSSLTSINLSNFDTSNVTDMTQMLGFCKNLTSINLSSFDTSNVTDMNHMFYQCFKITSLDLSSFNTSKVTNMEGMFANCYVLANIYVSNKWNISLVTNSTNMFAVSTALPNFNSSYVDKTKAHYNTGGYLTYKAV